MRGYAILLLLAAAAGAAAQPAGPIPVWIDTDPSVARGGHELDDGLALVQAFNSPELEVRGVSAVFGNAPLERAYPIARDIVERFGPADLPVASGAAGADALGDETEAVRAMADALRAGPSTILALGPVTNVASLIRLHPELVPRIQRIVAVAGRRPGQRFIAGTKGGRPLRDLNFELDPAAFGVLMDAPVDLVLAPFEISSKVTLGDADVRRFERGSDASRWLAPAAADWVDWWEERFGVRTFHPFDTLAVAYLTSPQWLTCEQMPAAIQVRPDDVEEGREKPYLLVGEGLQAARRLTYCHDVSPAFTEHLLERLLR